MEKEYLSLKRTPISKVIMDTLSGLIPQSVYTYYQKHKSVILMISFGLPVFALFLTPLFNGNISGLAYYLDALTIACIFAGMALTLNLEAGFLGLPNFGKVAFIAVGAYSFAIPVSIMTTKLEAGTLGFNYTMVIYIGLAISIIVSGLFGVLLALPTLKLREDYLAITTIVAGEILRLVLNNEDSLGGYSGFNIDNPVYITYDSSEFMSSSFITMSQLALILIITALSYYSYYRSSKKVIEHLPKDRHLLLSISKGFSTFVILGLLLVFLNYTKVLSYKALLGLDMLIIILAAIFIIYKSLLLNKIKVEVFYVVMIVVAIVDYLLGLITGNGATGIKYTDWYTFVMALGGMALVFVIVEELYYSPFGRTLKSIREDDTSSVSVGKSVFSFRLRALVVASALSGFMGSIFAMYTVIIIPQTFLPLMTFTLYIMMIIGGTANNKGVIFGAFVIQLLYAVTKGPLVQSNDFFIKNGLDPVNLGLIFVGITLIFFLIYAPEGIVPEHRYNNQRYYDMLYLNDEENQSENPLIAQLIKLSGSSLEGEEWITEGDS